MHLKTKMFLCQQSRMKFSINKVKPLPIFLFQVLSILLLPVTVPTKCRHDLANGNGEAGMM